jgi:hypothetical protein
MDVLARMQPPSIPDHVLSADKSALLRIVHWDKLHVAALLSGLSTKPEFHANGIRIDWLLRLVLSKSLGDHKPTVRELESVLNEGLSQSGVNRLEDPNEDLFCDLVCSGKGNFRVFPGQWEQASAYTQTLIEAFELLPDATPKREALDRAQALLALSDSLASRAQVYRGIPSAGRPFGTMQLPDDEVLFQLAQRVRFSPADLQHLGIEGELLTGFLLDPNTFSQVSDRDIGDTPLELRPLVSQDRDVLILSPANISLAVRSILIETALRGNMEQRLQLELMRRQEAYSEATGFWPVRRLSLSRPIGHLLRGVVAQYDEGRYLHVLQIPPIFGSFPEQGFATVRWRPAEVDTFIADEVSRFWNFIRVQKDHRESTTVLLLCSWGAPQSINPLINFEAAPDGWSVLPLSFADAAVLGACDGGNFRDVARLLKQIGYLESDGFSFMNPNGLLNMFGFYRTTDGNLIPEHLTEITPPTTIGMPTDEVLKPRMEGILGRDYRALPVGGDRYKRVQRTEWGKDGAPPIYGSLDDISDGLLSGAIEIEGRTWWIESADQGEGNTEWRYQIWNAVLQWLGAIGAALIRQSPELFPSGTRRVQLIVPEANAFERIRAGGVLGAARETVVVRRSGGDEDAVVAIGDEWPRQLQLAENVAETELVAGVLEALVLPSGENPSRTRLAEMASEAIGTADWRWLHAFEAKTPLERLAGHGLIRSFRPIPQSASSLIKCRSVWAFRDRSLGSLIEGEDECKEFLAAYRQELLASLISDVRRFSRHGIVISAARAYQAARHEQTRWRGTIRALRAIRGEQANENAFARQNEINAVQRATKAILEIAACEAPESGGLNPGRADMEDLYAKVLLLIGNSQIFGTIRGGLTAPIIKISPAGDLLTERDLLGKLMQPGAVWAANKALNYASDEYVKRRRQLDDGADQNLGWSDGLRAAIEAEYQVPAEAFVDLQFALTQLVELGASDIIPSIRHSQLARTLQENPAFPECDLRLLLQRLTLQRRSSWTCGLPEADIDIGRFDRPFSLINRPILMLDDDVADPLVLVSPVLVSDAAMYAISGLMEGNLNNSFWQSAQARSYAGERGRISGELFEETVAKRLRTLGLDAQARCKLSAILNDKVPPELGDIDVLAISVDRTRVWVIEAKNLRLCRTETEISSRMSEYRGSVRPDSKGVERPDKMFRHVRRVEYLRTNAAKLVKALKLPVVPEIRGLLIVDAPQPMNFHMLEKIADGESAFLGAIADFAF